jgi:hypothetical protein
MEVVFPGVINVEPNDSFIFDTENPTQGIIYQMRMAATPNNNGYTADDLESLLGTLPLLQYDPSMLEGLEIQQIEINGAPAVRVDDLLIGAAGGAVTESIALPPEGNPIVEFVIEPVTIVGMSTDIALGNGDPDANLGIMENILASFQFSNGNMSAVG